jgi:hypothetical protein
LQKITARVKPEVKAELERIARQWKVKGKSLSLSAVIDSFLERAVQGHVDMQYGALLKPTIEKTIRDETRSQRLFMAVFLARLALDIGQTRNLVTNLVGRHPDISEEVFKEILAESARTAKRNIIRRTPQVAELIDIVEQWMDKQGQGSKDSAYGDSQSKLYEKSGSGKSAHSVHRASANP